MWFLVAPKAQGCPPKTQASAGVRGLWPGLNGDTTWQRAFPAVRRLGPPGSAPGELRLERSPFGLAKPQEV